MTTHFQRHHSTLFHTSPNHHLNTGTESRGIKHVIFEHSFSAPARFEHLVAAIPATAQSNQHLILKLGKASTTKNTDFDHLQDGAHKEDRRCEAKWHPKICTKGNAISHEIPPATCRAVRGGSSEDKSVVGQTREAFHRRHGCAVEETETATYYVNAERSLRRAIKHSIRGEAKGQVGVSKEI